MNSRNVADVIGSRVVRFNNRSHVAIAEQALCGASLLGDSITVLDEPLCQLCFDNYLHWFMDASEFCAIAHSEFPTEYFETLASNVQTYGSEFRDGSDVAAFFVQKGDLATRRNAVHAVWPNKWLGHLEMFVNQSSNTPIKHRLWQLLLEGLAIPASA
jgi:hypothetical protein